LRESKNFAAELAGEGLLATMNIIVSFERELSSESFSTGMMLTNEYSHSRTTRRQILGNILIDIFIALIIFNKSLSVVLYLMHSGFVVVNGIMCRGGVEDQITFFTLNRSFVLH